MQLILVHQKRKLLHESFSLFTCITAVCPDRYNKPLQNLLIIIAILHQQHETLFLPGRY